METFFCREAACVLAVISLVSFTFLPSSSRARDKLLQEGEEEGGESRRDISSNSALCCWCAEEGNYFSGEKIN